jgi:hypothetical protein
MQMGAVSYFEKLTVLSQITIVTMVIVSYLDLLLVLRDTFFAVDKHQGLYLFLTGEVSYRNTHAFFG